MSKQKKNIWTVLSRSLQLLIWISYLIIFSGFVFGSAIEIFDSSSAAYTFYKILYSYNNGFIIFYAFNVLQVLMNLLSLIPLAGFIFQTNSQANYFWQTIFWLRFTFDLIGHKYTFLKIGSMFHFETTVGWLLVLVYITMVFPSYIACLQYSFYGKTRKSSK